MSQTLTPASHFAPLPSPEGMAFSPTNPPPHTPRHVFFNALKKAARNLVMVPVFPVIGYVLLDQPGISQYLMQHGIIPKAVLGEGFGHVGLCFSLHYVIHAVKTIGNATRQYWVATAAA